MLWYWISKFYVWKTLNPLRNLTLKALLLIVPSQIEPCARHGKYNIKYQIVFFSYIDIPFCILCEQSSGTDFFFTYGYIYYIHVTNSIPDIGINYWGPWLS